ncbi:hypothetical protein LUZ63_019722 [Rhynchospora breviuscula]|uniref:X8 domain-containing protein n=1 Tax=Rhynchospora breviuscula TaxID=2022672 RepID=A0A9Q0HJB3_9POAL|nr:hypothetical protein LUZ63_019722 [Rhynchospora breviuscula]
MRRLLVNLSSSLLLCLICGGSMVVRSQSDQKTWCVDCTIFQEGYSCFYPNNNISHASIAMNLYFQSRGRNNWNCDFSSSGLIVSTDPSFGDCVYQFVN